MYKNEGMGENICKPGEGEEMKQPESQKSIPAAYNVILDPVWQAVALFKISLYDPRNPEHIRNKYLDKLRELDFLKPPTPPEEVTGPVWLINWTDGTKSLISDDIFKNLKGNIFRHVESIDGYIGLKCAREKCADLPYIE